MGILTICQSGLARQKKSKKTEETDRCYNQLARQLVMLSTGEAEERAETAVAVFSGLGTACEGHSRRRFQIPHASEGKTMLDCEGLTFKPHSV